MCRHRAGLAHKTPLGMEAETGGALTGGRSLPAGFRDTALHALTLDLVLWSLKSTHSDT